MPTVKGVLQKYHEGQNIFRREAVTCLVARIEQLEKYIASQQSVQPIGGESAPLQALSTPEVDSIGGADTTPPAAKSLA